MDDPQGPDWVRGAPSDVFHAIVAVASLASALLIGRFFDQAIVAAAAALFDGLGSLPSWVFDAVSVTGAVLLVGSARRRPRGGGHRSALAAARQRRTRRRRRRQR